MNAAVPAIRMAGIDKSFGAIRANRNRITVKRH